MNSHEFHMMQLADSFFPSGAFGLSGGLESQVKSGRVKNAKDLLRLIRQQIRFQVLPCDCAVLLVTMNAASRKNVAGITQADVQYHSMKLVKEVRVASTRSGKQLLRTLAGMKKDAITRKFQALIVKGRSPGTYPVCLALAANALRIPKESAVRMLLYSYCASVVGSAVRMGIVSHIEGQSALTELVSDVNSARPAGQIHDLWQLNPLAEILQMQHEQDEFRMFIT
jgi:urease accessory protein